MAERSKKYEKKLKINGGFEQVIDAAFNTPHLELKEVRLVHPQKGERVVKALEVGKDYIIVSTAVGRREQYEAPEFYNCIEETKQGAKLLFERQVVTR
jgi:hypothetical protein